MSLNIMFHFSATSFIVDELGIMYCGMIPHSLMNLANEFKSSRVYVFLNILWKQIRLILARYLGSNRRYIQVQDHDFINNRFQGLGKSYVLMGCLYSFFKQFHGSVTKSDYTTLRLGFIMIHCRGNPKFYSHKYLMRTLEADFKKVVGIKYNYWSQINFHFGFTIFLLINVEAHNITISTEIAEKHIAIEGDLVVQPSDDHFWFNRPRMVLILIHIILFQNSFELAFFFGIWFLCSYSTMGSSFKKAIFDEHIRDGLFGWARMAKKKNTKKMQLMAQAKWVTRRNLLQ
ncbi:MLO-like protein 1 [Citrus sinensis]|nr:MLO-like protein 1 [Citrus sinensis]